MECPTCKSHEHRDDINLHSDSFKEDIMQCETCGTSWSVNHGASVIINDPKENTLLGSLLGYVEGYDYCFAA